MRARAERIVQALASANARVELVDSDASVGGGAFPTARIPSLAVGIDQHADAVEQRLRANETPVVCRVAAGRVLIDLRTVFPSEDDDVIAAIRMVIA